MLRVTPQKNADAASHYFASYKHGDYYNDPSELLGRWGGKSAGELGLSGFVRQADFTELAHNRHPETGARLTARNAPKRTVGADYTWSAGKGV